MRATRRADRSPVSHVRGCSARAGPARAGRSRKVTRVVSTPGSCQPRLAMGRWPHADPWTSSTSTDPTRRARRRRGRPRPGGPTSPAPTPPRALDVLEALRERVGDLVVRRAPHPADDARRPSPAAQCQTEAAGPGTRHYAAPLCALIDDVEGPADVDLAEDLGLDADAVARGRSSTAAAPARCAPGRRGRAIGSDGAPVFVVDGLLVDAAGVEGAGTGARRADPRERPSPTTHRPVRGAAPVVRRRPGSGCAGCRCVPGGERTGAEAVSGDREGDGHR